MASIDRLLRANRTVLFVPVVDIGDVATLVGATGATCPFDEPTSAVLDSWRTVTGTAASASSHGGNVSGAITDDMDLGLAASDTDNELVLTSIGNEVAPTFKNVDATFTGMRDKNKGDAGVYNLFTSLVVAADVRFVAVDRIGYPASTAFAAGQVVDLYELVTDVPLDQKGDRSNLKIQQAPSPTGNVLSQTTLAS